MKHITRHFDCLSDYVHYVSTAERHGDSSRTGSLSFTGTKSFEDAVDLAVHGWLEGLALVQDDIEDVKKSVLETVPRTALVYANDGGAWVDVSRYCAGEPEHFATYALTEAPTRIQRIVVNNCVSSAVTKAQFKARGAQVLSLVDCLETLGVRTEVLFVSSCENSSKHHLDVSVWAKRAEDALDREKLAFALIHPSMIRRFEFAVIEALPREIAASFLQDAYGHPVEYTGPERTDDCLYLRSMHYDAMRGLTKQVIVRWVKDQLEKQGAFQ